MAILLDMDGVLVDFIGGLVRHFNLGSDCRDYLDRRFGNEKPVPYVLYEMFDFDGDDFYGAMTQDFWANLEPLPWYSNLVMELCPLDDTFICTSPGYLGDDNDPYFVNAVLGKKRWIVNHMPRIFRRQTIFAYDKRPLASGNILIDDTESWLEHCPRMILVPAPWNSNYHIYWEGDQAVVDFIIKEYQRLTKST